MSAFRRFQFLRHRLKSFFRFGLNPDQDRKRDEDQSPGPSSDWSLLFGPGRAGMLIERGLFCLALAAIAKFAPLAFLHEGYAPIAQWIMLAASASYIAYGWAGALAGWWD